MKRVQWIFHDAVQKRLWVESIGMELKQSAFIVFSPYQILNSRTKVKRKFLWGFVCSLKFESFIRIFGNFLCLVCRLWTKKNSNKSRFESLLKIMSKHYGNDNLKRIFSFKIIWLELFPAAITTEDKKSSAISITCDKTCNFVTVPTPDSNFIAKSELVSDKF